MKLVDILARELTEWAGDVGAITQDKLTGELFDYYHCPLRGGNEREVSSIADDAGEAHDGASGAAVTRAEWQVAVDALNAPKVVGLDGEISDLLREEFDAWFLANAPKLSEKASWLDPDAMAIRRLARHAWQASRECLVIELPADAHLSRDGLDEHYLAGDMRDQIVESIHAAGVKTK